jgi:alpha-beta hydrolase superfamily lysophospholipase
LFGWMHSPGEPGAATLGLVICNPFGNEAVCAHRSIRHLAEQARQAGIAALRFDYDGTGDSAGHDHEPNRLAAWRESIHAAVDELKRVAGLKRVSLLGIRLGASLAAAAAAERDDIEALITIAPVVSGKAYVREMRLLRRAIDARRGLERAPDDENLEAAGFLLSAQTQASLGSFNLNRLDAITARHVLVLDRAELPGDSTWTAGLSERGASVDRKSVPGYTEMMLDSHESAVPHEMIRTAVEWLGNLRTADTSRHVHPHAPLPLPLPLQAASLSDATQPSGITQGVNLAPAVAPDAVTGPELAVEVQERSACFGSPASLFGIISSPQGSADDTADRKAVLLLNAGAVHHIGPNRLYVALARYLARRGYVVLRMDIAGIGDSPPRRDAPENVVYSKHALEDVRAAVEYLQREEGVKEVHAVGLCSGAYNAFKAAVANLPLAGAILVNPLTFFWKEGMSLEFAEHRIADDIQRYRTNAFRLEAWLKLLRGNVDLVQLSHVLLRRIRAFAVAPLRSVARTLGIPLQDDLPSELRRVVRAGRQLHFIFADRDPGQELLNTLAGATVRRLCAKGAIGIQNIAAADHTFTDRAARAALVAALNDMLAATPVRSSLFEQPQHAT